MTTDKMTSEETELWNDFFKVQPQFKETSKRVKNLYLKAKGMMEDESYHTDEEMNEVANQLAFANQRAMKLGVKMVFVNMRLVQLNPNFRSN